MFYPARRDILVCQPDLLLKSLPITVLNPREDGESYILFLSLAHGKYHINLSINTLNLIETIRHVLLEIENRF